MYLISIYFDKDTDNRIKSYMQQIAKHTGNRVMLDGNIPPHITLSAFHADSLQCAEKIFKEVCEDLRMGQIQWVSVATFLPQVIYLSPVLNEYLQKLSERIYKEVIRTEEVEPRGNYQPYGWMPHATLAKNLTKEQMKAAFDVMQNQFGPFESRVTKIGLAKTNPYTDLAIFDLK